MAAPELWHFYTFVYQDHLQSSRWVKIKSQKPCPTLFGHIQCVNSVRQLQAKVINPNWHAMELCFVDRRVQLCDSTARNGAL